jgi:hypothetical protein
MIPMILDLDQQFDAELAEKLEPFTNGRVLIDVKPGEFEMEEFVVKLGNANCNGRCVCWSAPGLRDQPLRCRPVANGREPPPGGSNEAMLCPLARTHCPESLPSSGPGLWFGCDVGVFDGGNCLRRCGSYDAGRSR